jgi:hypothetical protein
MFRLRVAKMLRHGLKSLDKLDVIKKAERIAKQDVVSKDLPPNLSLTLLPNPNDFLNPFLALALMAYDLFNPF